MYPFEENGKLCPILSDSDFLVEAYTISGYRSSIKTFCKKIKWENKPRVSISLGTEQLAEILISLFNSPAARAKLNSLQHKKSKIAAPPLHQAIWNWLLTTNPPIAEKFEENCVENANGLFFLSSDGLKEILKEYDTDSTDSEVVGTLARVTLAFAMLQPNDAKELASTFIDKFPTYNKQMGLS